jgi:hypothetical protein
MQQGNGSMVDTGIFSIGLCMARKAAVVFSGYRRGNRLRALLFGTLLAGTVLPLDAQIGRGISIFIPPVTGMGKERNDNDFFNKMLFMEIAARNFLTGDSRVTAHYSLQGSLSPQLYDDGEPYVPPMYQLHLSLIKNEDDSPMVEQDLNYSNLDETNEYLPLLIFTMLANIPPLDTAPPDLEPPEWAAPSDAWRNKWWYPGASLFWTPRMYNGTYESANLFNFGFGAAGELHFHNRFSVEAGVELMQDWIRVTPDTQLKNHVIELPLLLKLVFKPSHYFMLEPYAGIQMNFPLNSGHKPPIVSWLGGMQYGVKAGPGPVFVDARVVMDIGESGIEWENITGQFQRYTVKVGIGYKIGFLDH